MKSKGMYLTVAGLGLGAALVLGGPVARGQQADKPKNIGTVVYEDSSHQYRFLVDRKMAEGLEDFGVRMEDNEGNVVFECGPVEYAGPSMPSFEIKRVPENELTGDPKKMANGGKVVITAYRKDGENFVEIGRATEYVDEGDKFPLTGAYGNMILKDETDLSREFVEGGMNSGPALPEDVSGPAQPVVPEEDSEQKTEDLPKKEPPVEPAVPVEPAKPVDVPVEVPKDKPEASPQEPKLPDAEPPKVPAKPVVPEITEEEKLLRKAEAMGFRRPEIFNGYAVDMEGYSTSDLRVSAGLRAGKLSVYGRKGNLRTFGEYENPTDEEALAALKEADADSDKIVTPKEAEKLWKKALAEAFDKKEKSALEKARQAGATNPVVLGNGQVAVDEAAADMIRSATGVWMGSVKVRGFHEKYVLDGKFSEAENFDAFNQSCGKTDEDKDDVITLEEAKRYRDKVVAAYFDRILTTDIRLPNGLVLGAPYLDTIERLTRAAIFGKIHLDDVFIEADADGDRRITVEEAKSVLDKYVALAEAAAKEAEKLDAPDEPELEPPKPVPPVEPVAPVEPNPPEDAPPVVPEEDTGHKTEDLPELPADEPLPKDYQDIVDEITTDIRKYKTDLDEMKQGLLDKINPDLRGYAIRKSNEIRNYIRKTLEEEREKRAKKDKRLIERIDKAAEEELGK